MYEKAEDGGFYAHIPALGITTDGKTLVLCHISNEG